MNPKIYPAIPVESAVNLTSEAAFGAPYVATDNRYIKLTVLVGFLNGAAATFYPRVVITRTFAGSSRTVEVTDSKPSSGIAKNVSTDTFVQFHVGPFRVLKGDSVQLYLSSTNASDTAAYGVVYVDDPTASDSNVVAFNGVSLPTQNIQWSSQAVYNRSKLLPFYIGATTERAVMIGIGDSNQDKDDYGWQGGFRKAIATAGLAWSTGLCPCNNNGGQSDGYLTSIQTTDAKTGAPSEIEALMPSTNIGNLGNYAYKASGSSDLTMYLTKELPLAGNSLQFCMSYGVYPTWTGSFKLGARINSPLYGYANVSFQPTSPTISTTNATAGLVDGEWNFGPKAFAGDVGVQFAVTSGGNVNGAATGQTLFAYWQVVLRNVRAGLCFQTMSFYGGQPTKQTLIILQAWGQTAMKEYLRQSMLKAGPNKLCCIRIDEGFNDRNDTSASWNPTTGDFSGPLGNTQQGFYDNMQAIMELIKAAWASLGYPASSLYFAISPSFPQSLPNDDAQLVSYRTAADQLSDAYDNTGAIHKERLTNYAELVNSSYYQDGPPSPHLVAAGYDALAAYELQALLPTFSELVQNANTLAIGTSTMPTKIEYFPSGGGLNTAVNVTSASGSVLAATYSPTKASAGQMLGIKVVLTSALVRGNTVVEVYADDDDTNPIWTSPTIGTSETSFDLYTRLANTHYQLRVKVRSTSTTGGTAAVKLWL